MLEELPIPEMALQREQDIWKALNETRKETREAIKILADANGWEIDDTICKDKEGEAVRYFMDHAKSVYDQLRKTPKSNYPKSCFTCSTFTGDGDAHEECSECVKYSNYTPCVKIEEKSCSNCYYEVIGDDGEPDCTAEECPDDMSGWEAKVPDSKKCETCVSYKGASFSSNSCIGCNAYSNHKSKERLLPDSTGIWIARYMGKEKEVEVRKNHNLGYFFTNHFNAGAPVSEYDGKWLRKKEEPAITPTEEGYYWLFKFGARLERVVKIGNELRWGVGYVCEVKESDQWGKQVCGLTP